MINLNICWGKSGKKKKDREPKPIFGIPFPPPRCSAQLVEAASEVSARSDEE
jgi:hypothetical protein